MIEVAAVSVVLAIVNLWLYRLGCRHGRDDALRLWRQVLRELRREAEPQPGPAGPALFTAAARCSHCGGRPVAATGAIDHDPSCPVLLEGFEGLGG